MTVFANAKINLTLFVGQKQNDGYHPVSTLMQEVSLRDLINIERADKDAFFVSGANLPADGKNLCIKARDAFRTHTGINDPVSITLEKHIPHMAGLGGGSSDAAAVLKALSDLFDAGINYDEMLDIAATLGSDVPFFIGGGCRLCTGRGERVSQKYSLEKTNIVIAKGEAGLSTPEMYGRLDASGNFISDNASFAIITKTKNIKDALYNSFDDIAEAICPDVAKIKRIMFLNGAQNAMLCGSGSAVFGIYPDAVSADNAACILRENGFFAESCVTVD